MILNRKCVASRARELRAAQLLARLPPCRAPSLSGWSVLRSPQRPPARVSATMAMAEDMSVLELKEALMKMRVRCDHCVEKSELLKLYKEEVGRERPLPTAAAGFASATGAPAPAPMPTRPTPAPAPAPAAGSYVNGRYVPPPKTGIEAILGDFDFKTIAMVVIAIWWVWGVASQGGGGMDGVGDDEGEYDERDTSSYINGKVVEVVTHDQFLGALTHHRDNTGLPVVVDFFSHSCGPCRMIAPEYKKLARQFKGKAVFLKVDVNANYETSQAARVRAMPTFQFFQNGKKKHEFSGCESCRQLRGPPLYTISLFNLLTSRALVVVRTRVSCTR